MLFLSLRTFSSISIFTISSALAVQMRTFLGNLLCKSSRPYFVLNRSLSKWSNNNGVCVDIFNLVVWMQILIGSNTY
jgi:hypothetical protein